MPSPSSVGLTSRISPRPPTSSCAPRHTTSPTGRRPREADPPNRKHPPGTTRPEYLSRSGGWLRYDTSEPTTEGSVMKIGIIGAGNIGGNLTRRLTAIGHDVSVANSRGPQTLTALAEETGATPVTVEEAARGAQVVVVTIPLKAVPNLPSGFLDGAAENVAVIDTGNYYPQQRDGKIAEIEDGLTESRWTERQIGHPVIKAFNGTYAQDILDKPQPGGTPGRVALPVSGDDEAAKKVVRDLIDEIGFDTVDTGGQDESWRQQPGTPVYGLAADTEAVATALTEASSERTAEWRA
ncbi:NAD(P)-binding domain-containing protein [Streptomyces sp. NPDC047525]|uniref:NADPH-dependent F420 reductase n=1 Tax=Streptomyces sp. NPDC047525 TaxID=3155264 RepID=UPI0033D970A0